MQENDCQTMNGMNVNHDRHYARCSYERLILQQSHIPFNGLWVSGYCYYVVCPTLNEAPETVDGEPLQSWFDGKCRIITCPITIVHTPPNGAQKVPERTAEELSLLHGEPLTASDIYKELVAFLPRGFLDFTLECVPPNAIFSFKRKLNAEEDSDLRIACANIKLGLNIIVQVKEIEYEEVSEQSTTLSFIDNLSLISSRGLRYLQSSALRQAYEEDEEFWVDNKVEVFSKDLRNCKKFLPQKFTNNSSACFINATAYETKNLRTYLTLYRRVIFTMPLENHLHKALKTLKVSESELVELARRGRVQFVLPQPLERYSIDFLSRLIEAAPNSLLFSRRLAAATIVETRRRLPVLYPPFGSFEKRTILDLLASVENTEFGKIAKIFRQELGKLWTGMEFHISRRGAMGTAGQGVGLILGELYKQFTHKDVQLELIFASQSVEWAAAMNATLFPYESNEYSEYNAANICSAFYSGVINQPIVNPVPNMDVLLDGLLTLNNDAPILEVEEIFSHRDTDSLLKFITKIGSKLTTPEEIAILVANNNEKVKRYERHFNRLNRCDLFGLAIVLAGSINIVSPGPLTPLESSLIPFAGWLAKYILTGADPSRDVGGRVLDWLRATNSWTSSDIVLISRLRNK